MAGLFFDYVDDVEIWHAPHQFMCGRNILVAPVTEAGLSTSKVYLPSGKWRDFWSDQLFDGGTWVEVPAPLHQIPAFIKEGSTIY